MKTANAKLHLKCKECKAPVPGDNLFNHWMLHFKLKRIENAVVPVVPEEPGEVDHAAPVAERELTIDAKRELISKLLWVDDKSVKQCSLCNRFFSRINESKRHIIEHLLKDAYATKTLHGGFKCQVCSELIRTRDAYKYHLREHASLPQYKCDLCGKNFSDSSNFVKHKKVHNLMGYSCDICQKKFQMKVSLERHIELHSKTSPIVCTSCDKTFYSQSAFKKHQKIQHEKHHSRFRCPICNRYFDTLRNKWDHQWLVHKERRHKADCPICKKKFRKLQDVKQHVRSDHSASEVKQWERTGGNIDAFIRKTCKLRIY